MTRRATKGCEVRWGGRPRPRRPPRSGKCRAGGSAGGQGTRPANSVFRRSRQIPPKLHEPGLAPLPLLLDRERAGCREK
jgi:hypothetical protein